VFFIFNTNERQKITAHLYISGLLVAGCLYENSSWLLAVGFWLLASGYWLLVYSYWLITINGRAQGKLITKNQ